MRLCCGYRGDEAAAGCAICRAAGYTIFCGNIEYLPWNIQFSVGNIGYSQRDIRYSVVDMR